MRPVHIKFFGEERSRLFGVAVSGNYNKNRTIDLNT
jgi:hypothetical protein